MNCPHCGGRTEIKDSRATAGRIKDLGGDAEARESVHTLVGQASWRRHICPECGYRMTTYEIRGEALTSLMQDSILLRTIKRGLAQ